MQEQLYMGGTRYTRYVLDFRECPDAREAKRPRWHDATRWTAEARMRVVGSVLFRQTQQVCICLRVWKDMRSGGNSARNRSWDGTATGAGSIRRNCSDTQIGPAGLDLSPLDVKMASLGCDWTGDQEIHSRVCKRPTSAPPALVVHPRVRYWATGDYAGCLSVNWLRDG